MQASIVIEDEIKLIIEKNSPIDVNEIQRRYQAIFNKSVTNFEILMSIEKLKDKNLVLENKSGLWKNYSPVAEKRPSQIYSASVEPLSQVKKGKASNRSNWIDNKELISVVGSILLIIIIILKYFLT